MMMEMIVRAVDVGFGNTKYVTGATDGDMRCAYFPSVAYPSARDLTGTPAAERRKTVAVPIDGLFYEVGPEVNLAADTFRATQMHDRYTDTPEYAALLRGALTLMKVDFIDLLVVGLPVAAFTAKKTALEKAMTGKHDVGGGRTVIVRKALAVAQPQGALVYYASLHQKLKAIEHEQSLIIDPGARTFDWLVARGMRFVQKKSHSINRGVFDVVQAIATEISEDIGTPHRDFDAIDTALRTGKHPVIHQKPYNISRLMPIARTLAEQAVSSMVYWIKTCGSPPLRIPGSRPMESSSATALGPCPIDLRSQPFDVDSRGSGPRRNIENAVSSGIGQDSLCRRGKAMAIPVVNVQ